MPYLALVKAALSSIQFRALEPRAPRVSVNISQVDDRSGLLVKLDSKLLEDEWPVDLHPNKSSVGIAESGKKEARGVQ